MKSRVILPAVAFGLLSLFAANSAEAGLFGHGCCASDGCGPSVVWGGGDTCGGSSCCDPCGGRHGLLSRLKARCGGRKSCGSSCCDVVPSCGCEVSCGVAAPSCGAPVAYDNCASCEPTCGVAQPSCGCAAPCADSCCKPRCGLLSRLKAKLAAHRARRCCNPCGGCAMEASCGCEPSCGCGI